MAIDRIKFEGNRLTLTDKDGFVSCDTLTNDKRKELILVLLGGQDVKTVCTGIGEILTDVWGYTFDAIKPDADVTGAQVRASIDAAQTHLLDAVYGKKA